MGTERGPGHYVVRGTGSGRPGPHWPSRRAALVSSRGDGSPVAHWLPGWNVFRQALRTELSRLAQAGEFSGTVAIARGDSVLFEEGFGRALRPAGEVNGAQTLFHLASVGKMFTAVAIGQLVDAGQLSLDDSLAALLPQLPWAAASRPITVRQLLSHTSGLGQSQRADIPIDSAFATTPPAFLPGSHFSYSNEGFEILGLIIERTAAQPYWDYLRARVLRPAGMTATDAYAAEEPLPHRAIGYGHHDNDYFGAEALVPNTGKVRGRGTAAGGSYGTARDLLRFGDALLSGRLLRRETLDTLAAGRARVPGPHADEWYGYGFETHNAGDVRIIGHAGGGVGWGICSRLDVLLGPHYSVAVLSNVDPPVCEDVSRAIATALATRPSP